MFVQNAGLNNLCGLVARDHAHIITNHVQVRVGRGDDYTVEIFASTHDERVESKPDVDALFLAPVPRFDPGFGDLTLALSRVAEVAIAYGPFPVIPERLLQHHHVGRDHEVMTSPFSFVAIWVEFSRWNTGRVTNLDQFVVAGKRTGEQQRMHVAVPERITSADRDVLAVDKDSYSQVSGSRVAGRGSSCRPSPCAALRPRSIGVSAESACEFFDHGWHVRTNSSRRRGVCERTQQWRPFS